MIVAVDEAQRIIRTARTHDTQSFRRPKKNMPDEERREMLIERIDEIDAAKRDIKSQIHHAALKSKEGGWGIDQRWLRRAKDRRDYFTEERAEVRNELHTVNERIKDKRRALQGQAGQANTSLAQEFMKAAQRYLDAEVFDEILDEASLKVANMN